MQDIDRFRRLATAWCFIAAGALVLAGLLATPWEESEAPEAYLQAYLDHPVQGQVAALLLHYGFLLVLPALFGSLVVLKGRGAAWGHWAVGVGVVGWGSLPGFLIIDWYDMSLAHRLPLAQAHEISNGVTDFPGFFALAPPALFASIIGLTLLGIALWREGLVGWWVPVVLFASQVGGRVIPGPPLIGSALTGVLMLAAFVAIGLRIMRDPGPDATL